MTHDLCDDEGEELLGELRIQISGGGEFSQPGDLFALPLRVRSRKVEVSLELAHPLGDLESLGQDVHQGGIQIVNGGPQTMEFSG